MLATEGALRASFAGDPKSGSLRVQIDRLRFPDWEGPLSGEVVSTIRAEALFVTDQKGSTVPIPSSPAWLGEFVEDSESGGE